MDPDNGPERTEQSEALMLRIGVPGAIAHANRYLLRPPSSIKYVLRFLHFCCELPPSIHPVVALHPVNTNYKLQISN